MRRGNNEILEKINILTKDVILSKTLNNEVNHENIINPKSETFLKNPLFKEKLYSVFLGDYDLNRKLSVDNLRRVAEELGLELAENEIEEMIKSANPEEPDCISFDEFFRIMAKMEI